MCYISQIKCKRSAPLTIIKLLTEEQCDSNGPSKVPIPYRDVCCYIFVSNSWANLQEPNIPTC